MPLAEGILSTDAGRYRIGSPGDTVVLGRWDCGPIALPALLHPGTGQVWVFDRWPVDGADVAPAAGVQRVGPSGVARSAARSVGL